METLGLIVMLASTLWLGWVANDVYATFRKQGGRHHE